MDSKNLRLKPVLFAFILWPAVGFAGAHYAPQPCAREELTLSVSNPTPEEQEFWIQVRQENAVTELAYRLPPQKQLQLEGTQFLPAGAAFSIRQRTRDLQFLLSCNGVAPMTEAASPRVSYAVPAGELVLHLQNLHHAGQQVDAVFLDFWGRELSRESFVLDKNYVSLSAKLSPPKGTKTVLLEGQARLSSQLFKASTMQALTAQAKPAKVMAPGTKAYFLAANDAMTESYIVPLEDPNLIAQARAIVNSDLAKITVADIEPAFPGAENRDLLADDGAPWSWRVKQVHGFSDIGHQDCSGSPGFTEDFKETWMPGEREICYWTFSLKRELTADEVSSGRLRRSSSKRPAPAFPRP